jgi:hypothetical protein
MDFMVFIAMKDSLWQLALHCSKACKSYHEQSIVNVFIAWFDPICQQDCTAAVRSSALFAPQEGRFFGGKQLKKESIQTNIKIHIQYL